jgi:mannitol-1-phosphate/altronate dehydrogenase
VAAHPGGRDLLERVAAEIAEVIEAPDGADVDAYVATTIERFENTGLGHRCAQIAVDTSRKLPQRLLDTWRDRRARGLSTDALADALALWAWSTLGQDHRGEPRPVDDPLVDRFNEIASTQPGDPTSIAVQLVAIKSIFGDLAADTDLTSAIAVRLNDLIIDAPTS